MRFRLFEKSLLVRLALAMGTISLLAVLGMGSSVIIAEMMKGDAAAINQAGSLRMQSYRIGTRLLAERAGAPEAYTRALSEVMAEFEQRLHSPRLVDIIAPRRSEELFLTYDRIAAQWSDEIKPRLAAHIGDASEGGGDVLASAALLEMLDSFVAGIDQMVMLLEWQAEAKIQWLRVIQGVSLFLTLIVVYVTMYLTHTDVLTPLWELLAFAQQARRGDFSARVQHVGEDELGELGKAFNVMAEDLSKMYEDLESRVQEKTADLERSNRSLELLYTTLTHLNEAPESEQTYQRLLHEIEKLIGTGPGAICVVERGPHTALPVPEPTVTAHLPLPCTRQACHDCINDSTPRLRVLDGGDRPNVRVFTAPLKDREQVYGSLVLEVPPQLELAPWQIQLLEALARHIGIAIGTTRRSEQGRRLALLEERGVIARELHDSLAQSLSYLKIQVLRLQSLLGKPESRTEIDLVAQELREGLNGAYRELRELLTTFRIQMDGRGLAATLEQTMNEFRSRSGMVMLLQNRLLRTPLTTNEEIHILQIVREALSNVIHHAQATLAEVELDTDAQGRILVTVDDNGVGITENPLRKHHYGLVIMQERTQSLNGELSIERRPEGGTRVKLRFAPAKRRDRDGEAINTTGILQ
jgi:two-component system, NarL family, nitrate/nitrite sensor histidine kinase NarX